MKVKELIEVLQKMNPDLPVFTSDGPVEGVLEDEMVKPKTYTSPSDPGTPGIRFKAVFIQN